jgi:hypothetical protein
MPKRVIFFVSMAVAVGLTVRAPIDNSKSALAASECVEQPNREPVAGGHWHYRTDRITGLKCWYLTEPDAVTSRAEAPRSEPSSKATIQQENVLPPAGAAEPVPPPTFNRAQPDTFEE